MTRLVDVPERVGNWLTAYEAIRAEITPAEMRTILAEMSMVNGIEQLQSYMSLARNVMANDRAAALAAAMLVTSGIRPLPVDYGETE
jgi:hypothetical protein